MPKTVCPCCGRKLRVPDHLAGRRVTCPRCNEALAVPEAQEAPPASAAAAPSPAADESLPPPARIGLTALALGLASVLVLCLPLVGYAAIVLSAAGLLLSLWGLFLALTSGPGTPSYSPAAVGGGPRRFGSRPRDYPLAGLAACALALTMALLPFLLR